MSETLLDTGSNREIHIFGQNFGPPLMQGEVGTTGFSPKFHSAEVMLSLRHVSHVEISFVVPDWQVGVNKPIVVTVGGQVSNSYFVSFAAPTVLDVAQSEVYRSIYRVPPFVCTVRHLGRALQLVGF